MAVPNADGHGTFSPVVSTRPTNQKALRVLGAGAAVILACAAVVALVGASTQGARPSALVAVKPKSQLDVLAGYFLKHGETMTPKTALATIRQFEAHAPALMARLGKADTQMLADAFGHQTQQLEDPPPATSGSLLCEKRAKIIALFDTLLAKLGGEELSANITMGKVTDEWKDAMTSWLDSESKYRLTVEQVKEAKEGASFAKDEYEKWKTAYKLAQKDLDDTIARNVEERKNIVDEQEVIKEIMRYLGVLHDVQATEKSIAAGGRDSVKDKESGVSDPYATQKKASPAQLQAKLKKLQTLALKTKVPGATQQLAQLNKLAVYSETEEVARILKEMLSDLETRLAVIDEVQNQAQKLKDDSFNEMIKWEQKLVTLSSDADRAKEKMLKEKLQRENLAGTKDVAENNYKAEDAAYKVIIPPYEREIYVITMIKIKINTHCDKLAKGEASVFGQ